MWLIFLIVMLAIIFVGLILWWIGNKVYLAIKREQRKFELEEVGFEETKEKLKNAIKNKEES